MTGVRLEGGPLRALAPEVGAPEKPTPQGSRK